MRILGLIFLWCIFIYSGSSRLVSFEIILTGTRKCDHITPVLNDLGWLSVPATLALYDAILTFKCLKGLAPKYLSSRFNTRASVHGRNTRNRNKLDIPVFNTAAGQRSFIYRAVKCWNSLPEEITKCEDLCSFKSKAKSYFFTVFAWIHYTFLHLL